MERVFTCHQPCVIPYPGFWLKMAAADVFGHLASVTYWIGGYQNRVRVGWDGRLSWWTIPVQRKYAQRLDEVRVAETLNVHKLATTIEQTYSKSPHWREVSLAVMGYLYQLRPGDFLTAFNLDVNRRLRTMLGIVTPTVLLPPLPQELTASERLARWTEMNECSAYLAGPAARQYLEEEPFTKRHLKIVYMEPVPDGPYSRQTILSVFASHGADWQKRLTP